jgi:hypothetical protein
MLFEMRYFVYAPNGFSHESTAWIRAENAREAKREFRNWWLDTSYDDADEVPEAHIVGSWTESGQ